MYQNKSQPAENTPKTSSEIVYRFTQNTTIHGVKYVAGSHRSNILRCVWFLCLLICIGTCGYFLGKNMKRYFDHNVKTTTMIEFVHEVTFPAITICNENLARRSIIGASPEFIKGLAAFFATDVPFYQQYVVQTLATCTTEKHNQSDFLDTGLAYWLTVGMASACHYLTPDSFQSVKMCNWRQQPINCSTLFLNHITDYGWCFTFNPSAELLTMYTLGYNSSTTGYGVASDFTPLTVSSAGPNNGLQILLDVNQDDYCMPHPNSAAGFKVLIHDPNVQPLYFLESALNLSPGFNYDVAIKFERQQKTTESLGRCTHIVDMPLYPSIKTYFREACYVQCFSDYVYDKCGCIPPYGPPGSTTIKAKLANVTTVYNCWGSVLICMKGMEREFLNSGVDITCPQCKPECNVTKNHISSSSSYFPAINLAGTFDKYLPEGDVNLTELEKKAKIRDNLILVNFFIESKQLSVTIEVEDFTSDQLLSAAGGTVGFFLGMSILSAMEVLQVIFFMMFPSLGSKRKSRNKSINPVSTKQQMEVIWAPPPAIHF